MIRVADPESPFADVLVEMSRDHFEKMAGLATRTYAAQQMGRTIAHRRLDPELMKEAGVGVDFLKNVATKGVGLVRRGAGAVKSFFARGGQTAGRAVAGTGPHGTVLESVPRSMTPEVAARAGRVQERAAAMRGQAPASMSMATGPTQMRTPAPATAVARPTPGTMAGTPPQPAFPSGVQAPHPGAGTVGGPFRAQPAPGSVPLHPSPSTAPGYSQLPGTGSTAANVQAVDEIERAARAHLARGTRGGAGQVLSGPPGLTGASPVGGSVATGVASPAAQRAAAQRAAGPMAGRGGAPGGAAGAEMAGAGAGGGAGAVAPRPATPANLPPPGRVSPAGSQTIAEAAEAAGMAPNQLQQARHLQNEMADILQARVMGKEFSPGATRALQDVGRRHHQLQAVVAQQAGNPRQAEAHMRMARQFGSRKGAKSITPAQAQRMLEDLQQGGLAGTPQAVGQVAAASRGAGQVAPGGRKRLLPWWVAPTAIGAGAIGIPAYAFMSGASQLAQANQGTAWRHGTHGPPINY